MGNWAKNEQRDTPIRYLLDELHTYKTDYSHALAPSFKPCEAKESSIGDPALIRSVSVEDVRSMMDSFDAAVSDLRMQISQLHSSIHELVDILSGGGGSRAPEREWQAGASSHSSADSSCVGHLDSRLKGPTIRTPPRTKASQSTLMPVAGVRSARRASSSVSLAPTTTNASRSASSSNGPTSTTSPSTTLAPSRRLPTLGLVIPNVPVRNPDGSRRPKSESWRDIVKHWTEGDPELGLHIPLGEWLPGWIRGSNRVFASKFHQRSVIALEFIKRFDSNEANFLAAYPEANQGHSALLRAINRARLARGDREELSWSGITF